MLFAVRRSHLKYTIDWAANIDARKENSPISNGLITVSMKPMNHTKMVRATAIAATPARSRFRVGRKNPVFSKFRVTLRARNMPYARPTMTLDSTMSAVIRLLRGAELPMGWGRPRYSTTSRVKRPVTGSSSDTALIVCRFILDELKIFVLDAGTIASSAKALIPEPKARWQTEYG
jgi:hypothetical protein